MKKILLLPLLLFLTLAAIAQKPLTDSRTSSFYTYIYKIDDATTQLLINGKQEQIKQETLTNEIAKYPTDHPESPVLSPGNYVKVVAIKNKLVYKLIQNRTANLMLFNGSKDVSFVLMDADGNEIKDAQVYRDSKLIPFDKQTETYHISRSKKDSIYKVVYKGVNNFYIINPYKTIAYIDASNPKKTAGLWTKFKSIFSKKKPPIPNNYYIQTPSPHPGFMALNKPKYKPGDTVKLKAFILQKKSKLPIEDKEIIVRLNRGYGTDGKIIAKIKPYRKGAFEFEFKVNQDSLQLILDQYYRITLEAFDPLISYKTDRESISKRIVYQQGGFNYEDYNLKTNQFNVRVDQRDGSPGLLPSLYFKATDDNGLNVADGRVKILLKPGYISNYGDKKVFVPDTLWQHDLPLDAVGETKLTLPDSIFPKANFSYSATIKLLNSDNETRDKYESLYWNYNTHTIKTDFNNDSLKIDYRVNGKSTPAVAWLTRINTQNDTTKAVQISLPTQVAVGPLTHSFIIKTDSVSKTVINERSQIQINSFRTKDSLFINVTNPRKLKFWYTIYGGNKVVDQGSALQLDYRKPIKFSGDVAVRLNYVYNGQSEQTEVQVPLLDKYLQINVNQPVSVYPGQQAEIEVDVKDFKGKPVANADITAFGITKKFENYQPPIVSYLGTNYKYRKIDPFLQLKQLADTGRVKLNWQHWSKSMGLDSIQYYRFTHTDSIYTITEPNPDKSTQIAPFVVENGDIIPVHILSIDQSPVYFSQSEDLPRYSFNTTYGKHTLTLRTLNKVITVNNVDIPFGKKLILSINGDIAKNPKLIYQNMPDTLTRSEQMLVSSHTIAIVPNWGQNMATLRQFDKIFLINPQTIYNRYYQQKNIVVGPLLYKNVTLQIKGGTSRDFFSEGGYSFEFQPGLIKQKSYPATPPYVKDLTKLRGATDYRQYPLRWTETEDLWNEHLINRTRQSSSNQYNSGTGKLVISPGKLSDGTQPYIKHILVFQHTDPDFMQLYPGTSTQLGSFNQQKHRILFIYKDNSYHLMENIVVKAGGTNYFDAGIISPKPADSLTNSIARILLNRTSTYITPEISDQIKFLFNGKYVDKKEFVGVMSGYVYDAKTNEPLTGANIGIKNFGNIGQADINGHFTVKVPQSGTLTFNFVSYDPVEVPIKPGEKITVKMWTDAQMAQEVVIRGYVKRNREQTTGSSYIITGREVQDNPVANVEQLLQGKVAGLNIPNATGDLAQARLNGKSFLPADILTDKSLLAADETTVPEGAAPSSQSLRRNFSDYAYWLPKLSTDADGKVKFKVTYPDDITAWQTLVIGVTDNRQSGTAQGKVKAYKPISANFVSPVFAVRGDEFSALGKVLNYTNDTIKINRKFTYNDRLTADNNFSLQNSRIDTFKVVAAGTDSLTFEYAIKRDNGYFDGERRQIPLFEQGSLETKGSFDVLEQDTTITLTANSNLKEATVRAEASALPALLDETEHLRNYEYLCNEQLASKLKALLAEKQIRGYLKLPFKWDNNVNEIIKKLLSNRNSQGTWGWWKDTQEEIWISAHAMEALLLAQERGFVVSANYQSLINYLVARLVENNANDDRLTMIGLLKKLNSNADLKQFVTNYEQSLDPKRPLGAIHTYRLMLVRQSVGLPVVMDTLTKHMKRTMFGNVYWGTSSYYLFDNSIQQSLLAYKILRNEGKHPQLLTKLRNFFMEQRADGYWRNTYESAQILETILPDMLVDGEPPRPAQLHISGAKNETVTNFPYTTTLAAGTQLKISKTGNMPVYITAYQKFWNPTPQKVSDNFVVDTKFTKGQSTITSAKGGETIYLTAEVEVKADADFVMVEIPIPAGCSYENKFQAWGNGEIHREYFKNKVSIFCRKLKASKYTYTVQLTARYGGNYHVNPAKAEMMYFPVFYAREEMKMFKVE